MSTLSANSYEALSQLAGREGWCWRIPCTTCGNMHFRHGLRLLARGESPTDATWPVHASEQIPRSLGPVPMSFTPAEQSEISRIVSEADFHRIAETVRSPDWLGHLGLVLLFTEQAESESGLLTRTVGSQLAAMCDEEGRQRLRDCERRGMCLNWRMLESVEHSIARGRA